MFLVKKGISKNLTENLIIFAPFWVRELLVWNGKDGAGGLVRHLLTLHKVSGFLEGEWSRSPEAPRLKWQCLHILLGQEATHRRAARLFNWTIGGNFLR